MGGKADAGEQVQQQNDVTSDFIEKAWPEMASAVANGPGKFNDCANNVGGANQ